MTRIWRFVRHSTRTLVAALVRLPRAILAEIGARELLLACGLLSLGYGCYLVYPPAGFIVPGLILTWNWLPTRPPFVARPSSARPSTRPSKESI